MKGCAIHTHPHTWPPQHTHTYTHIRVHKLGSRIQHREQRSQNGLKVTIKLQFFAKLFNFERVLIKLFYWENLIFPKLCTCCPSRPMFMRRGCCGLCFWRKPTELARFFFLFFSFCLCGLFNCISFHKFSQQLFTFSLCSSSLISALLVLSTIYLFMKVSSSPDIILCGWLGLKHQLTN